MQKAIFYQSGGIDGQSNKNRKMAPQTETKAGTGFKAGVKDYRLTYYTPDYQVKDTDILAAFRMTPQPGVPVEEAGQRGQQTPVLLTGKTIFVDNVRQLY